MKSQRCSRRGFERALPRLERHARIYFRSVRCPHKRADYIAEALALSWAWWLRLRRRGKRPECFIRALAAYAARAAGSGRRVCGHERSQEVLSPVAQRRHGFRVGTFPSYSTRSGTELTEALCENTATPVPEQVCFRLDFPAWLLGYGDRHRRMIQRMMRGERTLALAAQFGLSPARVSQLRRAFKEDWTRFTGGDGKPAKLGSSPNHQGRAVPVQV